MKLILLSMTELKYLKCTNSSDFHDTFSFITNLIRKGAGTHAESGGEGKDDKGKAAAARAT